MAKRNTKTRLSPRPNVEPFISYIHEKFDVWLSWVRLDEFGSSNTFYLSASDGYNVWRSSLRQTSIFIATNYKQNLYDNVYLASFGRKFTTDLILISWLVWCVLNLTSDRTDDRNLEKLYVWPSPYISSIRNICE